MENSDHSNQQNPQINRRVLQELNRRVCLLDRQLEPILEKYNAGAVAHDDWHCHNQVLQMLEEISSDSTDCNLYTIGTMFAECIGLSEKYRRLDMALAEIDDFYQKTHRGLDIGGYQLLKWKCGTLTVTCDSPYPCDLDRGLIESVARKFSSPRERVSVIHDHIGLCRGRGEEHCTYRIELSRN